MNLDDIQRDSYGSSKDSALDIAESVNEKLTEFVMKLNIFGKYAFPIQFATILLTTVATILSIPIGEATRFNNDYE